jgi:uncharacterized protein (TIGR02300 family)
MVIPLVRAPRAGLKNRLLPVRLLALTAPQLVVMGTTFEARGNDVAKSELGTKRIDPETGRKFYDLNKDPIVSPYTGKSYPRSHYESGDVKAVDEEEEVEEKEVDAEEDAPEVISLEEAEEDTKPGTDLPDAEDDEDVDLGEDEDDTFLADEEEEDDDVADIIGVGDDDDEI